MAFDGVLVIFGQPEQHVKQEDIAPLPSIHPFVDDIDHLIAEFGLENMVDTSEVERHPTECIMSQKKLLQIGWFNSHCVRR